MKAAAFASFGGPEVLQIMEVPTPQAGPGQVRVRIRAAGVQPYDAAVRAGWVPPGVTGDLPRIPGNEFAGVVDQVGGGVTGLAEGAEVLGFSQLGCYAEYVVVGAGQVTAKPPGLPWEVAGGLTAGVQTAELALDTIGVGEGDTLLVHAAAGSVGTAAVQFARARGAAVIGTARPDNHAYLRELGAVPVAYGEGLAGRVRALAPGGVDAAIDGAGGEALQVSLELVEDRARIVTLVEHGRAAELGVRTVQGERTAERLGRFAELYARGAFAFHLRGTYPMERAADAHREIEARHGRGKVVITVP
ncbi:NADP-dependent oxidoreductase [Planomonospora venezuelensis]|uniref:NADPH:quinone reductase-like Zn-dependent oxidoreductase n=1 Tax=Planomonospora venezuelensis TaxID=1999 RepID=A0A841DBL4_PLAVE|nr:NADP-dependent oxidoreductase [Planomonospora venezuelensis]MBB5968042.1 NADPH:quinone reductase-like Zn-dependent oxidoreductase [Planomonospora venezuelensis]GIN04659.1 oxidoreductase [Planomonospora venezuelensis]